MTLTFFFFKEFDNSFLTNQVYIDLYNYYITTIEQQRTRKHPTYSNFGYHNNYKHNTFVVQTKISS